MHELLTIKDILVSLEMRLTSVVVLECGNRNAGTALRACLDANANAANGGGGGIQGVLPFVLPKHRAPMTESNRACAATLMHTIIPATPPIAVEALAWYLLNGSLSVWKCKWQRYLHFMYSKFSSLLCGTGWAFCLSCNWFADWLVRMVA